MKKIIASAGMVVVGTAGLHGAYAPGLTPQETAKPFSVSASLRGFYDDNYVTAPRGFKQSSTGFEVKPGVAYNLPREQTYVKLSYDYTLRYYADRKNNSTDNGHEFLGEVDHRFSQRYDLKFSDSFVFSQEPEVLGDLGAPIRTDSDAMRNRATLEFTAVLTELLALRATYQNAYYDYFQNANDLLAQGVPNGGGSRSALLDRMEHLFDIQGRWQAREHLVALLGYQYGIVDYTSSDPLSSDPLSLPGTSRDNSSHFFYTGADYALSSELTATARVGVQYTSYDTLPGTSLNPYADVRAIYTYLPGSFVQLGIKHQRIATDVAGNGTLSNITKDVESTTVYGSVNHRITPRITGNLIAQYQSSSFKGGSLDGKVENFLILGLYAEYKINNNFSAEAGYDFDRLDSDAARSFTRNRVYVGARAKY